MKRLGFFGFILLGILTHSLGAFQNPPEGGGPESESYIVLLKQPSVLETVLRWNPGVSLEQKRLIWDSRETRQYQQRVEANQMDLLERLASAEGGPSVTQSSLEVLDRRSFLLNMILVRSDPEGVERLRQSQEVKGVFPNAARYPLLDSAPQVVGAPVLWDALGGIDNAGQGIKIGIIDSGISHQHPMFSGDGFAAPAGFPQGDLGFTNNKVIVARNYVKPELGLREQDNKTPEDELGHGSRVASVAAGKQVVTPQGTIQGIAPMAYLGNYRVFGNPSINPTTTIAALVAAIKDSVFDGMDVINLSLGGEAQDPAEDPEQLAIALAQEAGVVVVVAAGNTGPDPRTLLSPGTSPEAITVGATSNGRFFASLLEILSALPVPAELQEIPYGTSTASPITQSVGPLAVVSVAPLDATELVCNPLPADSLTGQVVLVQRGVCLFATKALHVLNAGAEGMVVFNNINGSAVEMAGLENFDRPAVMIQKATGDSLRDFLNAGSGAKIVFRPEDELHAFPAQADLLTEFSARGPNIDLAIKPDLSAPGQNIHAASNKTLPQNQYSLGNNGTSFSAPMVAGAAALIRQLNQPWSEQLSARDFAQAVKSVLVNTAAKTVTWNDQPARLIHTGNGRLDLAQALTASAALDPVSISFGLREEKTPARLQHDIELINLSSQTQTFQIEVSPVFENSSVQISVVPAALALSPGESVPLQLNADFSSPSSGGTFEGFLRISGSDGTRLTAPYWGGVTAEDNSVVLRVSQNGEPDHDTIESAVEAARPGNIIEFADSDTHTTLVNLGLNAEGLHLNGVTVRSATGQQATIDARELGTNSAAVTVSGLKGVTIEGLRLLGGQKGVSYRNSSGVIRDNIIEDTADRRSLYGIELSGSQAHVYGNTITGRGTGIAAFSTGSLIQNNLLESPGEFQENNGNGILASSQSLLGIFDNQIRKRATGILDSQGIRVSHSSALIKGNTIEQAQHDGILAQGQSSRLAILDNKVQDNGRHGIYLETGAKGSIVGNRIDGNLSSGLFLEENSRAEVYSSHFTANGNGILSDLSQLEVFDSLVTGSTQSHGISTNGGTLTIQNTTIFGNGDFGVRVSGTGATILDSILDQNASGELFGLPLESISNNLISDGQFQGINGNVAGDPLFSNPLAQDFSLQAGSPAIDRGTRLTPFSSTDLTSHERVFDGDGDGLPQADLGALEFGSNYWTAQMLPVLSTQATEFVGLAMVNGFHEPATVLLRAYTPDGQLSGSVQREIPAGEQITLLLQETFNPLQPGWIEILSDRRDLLGFTLVGNQALSFMDGTNLLSALSSELLLPEIRAEGNEQTRLYLINPHGNDVEVKVRWVKPSGPTLEKTLEIPAKGLLDLNVTETFGTGTGGYLTASVSSGQAIGGLETFGLPDSLGALPALDWLSGGSTLYSAQLASSEDIIETTVNIVNQGPPTDLTLEAMGEDGQVISSHLVSNLPEGGQFQAKARDIFDFASELVAGWLRVSSSNGLLLGTVTFADPAGRFLAALPLQAEGAREFVLGHVVQTGQIFSGLALLNASSDTALVSVEVFSPAGESQPIAFLELAPGQRLASLFNELMPGLQIQTGGFAWIRSNLPVLGFEIFGGHSLDFMSAVPQQVLVR